MSGFEALGTAIKVFVEKHLIPFVTSIVAGILSLVFTPNDCWILNKIGSTLYSICIGGVVFLLIQLIIFTAKNINSRYKKSQISKSESRRQNEEEKRVLDMFWSKTDDFSPDDRQLIREFVTTKNAPIERNTNSFYTNECLLGSDFVISTIKSSSYRQPIPIHREENDTRISIPAYEYVGGIGQYVLKSEIFKIAKYSMENYGRISHFD